MIDFEQILREVHDLLHKGDHAGAHELCHRAFGIDGTELQPDRPSFYGDFERAFLTAVRKHNVPAAYVIFAPEENNPQMVRVIVGGNVYALNILEPALKAGMDALGTRQNPSRPN